MYIDRLSNDKEFDDCSDFVFDEVKIIEEKDKTELDTGDIVCFYDHGQTEPTHIGFFHHGYLIHWVNKEFGVVSSDFDYVESKYDYIKVFGVFK